jgi:hydrogenase nickel incorporation protein HypA/HybF
MHELPFVESILQITLEHAEKAGARKVVALDLVIGQMTSIVDDSVQFYWDILSRGTLAQGARLKFQRLLALYRCQDCGHTYSLDGHHLACPQCDSACVQLVQGDELRLESIEIEA